MTNYFQSKKSLRRILVKCLVHPGEDDSEDIILNTPLSRFETEQRIRKWLDESSCHLADLNDL